MSLFSLVLLIYAAGVTLCLGVSVARSQALRREHADSVQKVQDLGASIARMVAKVDELEGAVLEVFPVEHKEDSGHRGTPSVPDRPPLFLACVDETGSTLIKVLTSESIVSSQPIPWAVFKVLGVTVEVSSSSKARGVSSLRTVECRMVSRMAAAAWVPVQGEERAPGVFSYPVPRSTLGPEDRVQVRLPSIPGLHCQVFVEAEAQRG